MKIDGLAPNFSEGINSKGPSKSEKIDDYKGPSFASNLQNLSKAAANMQVATGNNAAQLQMNRQKEDQFDLFSFTETEEEIAKEYIAQIEKLLKQFKDPGQE